MEERWIEFYRRNLDKFCEEYLGVKLKTYQKIILRSMTLTEDKCWRCRKNGCFNTNFDENDG